MRSEEISYSSSAGWRRRYWYIVGTPEKMVTPALCMAFRAASGSKRGTRATVVPL
jgi:hypothetical protein